MRIARWSKAVALEAWSARQAHNAFLPMQMRQKELPEGRWFKSIPRYFLKASDECILKLFP